jgi:hypothetical protein
MALQMKPECERCHQALPENSMAMICSLRMHFLQEMRGRDEEYLPELWQRAAAASEAEVNNQISSNLLAHRHLKTMVGLPCEGWRAGAFAVKVLALFDKVPAV